MTSLPGTISRLTLLYSNRPRFYIVSESSGRLRSAWEADCGRRWEGISLKCRREELDSTVNPCRPDVRQVPEDAASLVTSLLSPS